MPARVLTEAQRAARKEYNRRYYLKHLEQSRASRKRYQREHGEAHLERNRQYCLRHPDRVRAKWERQHRDNPRSEYHAEYRRINKEACAARVKAWAQKNQARRTAAQNKRRVKTAVSPEDAKQITDFYVRVRAATRIPCYWCGKNVPKSKRHIDHIVPLAKGGAHALLNLCCSCRKCNILKRDKLPADFHPQLQMFV